MQRAEQDATTLGVRHEHIPAGDWARPWLHDPPNPNPDIDPFDEFLSRKQSRDETDSDYEPSSDDSSDDDSSDSSDDDSSEDASDDSDDGMSETEELFRNEDEVVALDRQLDHAMHTIHDAVNPHAHRRMIKTPSGKLISKTTAVMMLQELLVSGVSLSKDRLRRIEQCAGASTTSAHQLVDHDGTHLDLFQDIAMVFDDGPGTPLYAEFGRVQKMVIRNSSGKRTHLRLTAIPFDSLPAGLEIRCRFYKKIRGHQRGEHAFRYSVKPDVKRYAGNTILMMVHFQYDQDTKIYTLPDDQYQDVNKRIRALEDSRKDRGTSARGKQRADKHMQEAREIEGDRRSRYRGDTATMTQTRRERAARRTGTRRTVNEQTDRTPLQVGMRVRLYHEVSLYFYSHLAKHSQHPLIHAHPQNAEWGIGWGPHELEYRKTVATVYEIDDDGGITFCIMGLRSRAHKDGYYVYLSKRQAADNATCLTDWIMQHPEDAEPTNP